LDTVHTPRSLSGRGLEKDEAVTSYCLFAAAASVSGVKPIDPGRLLRDAGRRLAEARQARGLTQQALADELGVSMRYVQSVEGGGENLTLRSLAGYASVVGISIPEVFQPPATRRPKVGRPRGAKPK